MYITKGISQSLKGYVLYYSNYMTFWKRQNYGDSKKISGSQEFRGEGGMDRQAQRFFQSSEITLSTTIMMEKYHIHFTYTYIYLCPNT